MNALSVRTDKASTMLPSEVTGEAGQHCASVEAHNSARKIGVNQLCPSALPFFPLLILLPKESKAEHWTEVQNMLLVR